MEKKFLFLIVSIFFLLISLNLICADCRTSLDDYAVEVLLNKEGISHNLDLLKNAENVNYINKNYILQSSSSPNMAIILSKVSEPFCENCVSLRVQIPVNRTMKEIPYIEFSTKINNRNMIILEEIKDWSSNCLVSLCSFYKNNISVDVDNTISNITKINIEIAEDNEGNYCGGKIIYSSSKAFCITKQNKDDIENLLKKIGVINNFEELFISYKIEGSGKKVFYDFSPQLNSNFFSHLENQNLTINNKTDLESLKWDVILDNEIRWMRFNSIISLNIKDIEQISKLAKLGYAGTNKRIYYGIDKNGNAGWMYYYETASPRTTKFKNCESFSVENIPSGFVYVNQPDRIKINLYYVLPIIFSFILLVILLVLIFLSRKKIEKELKKEEKEILQKNN